MCDGGDGVSFDPIFFLVDCFVADSTVQVSQAKYNLEDRMSLAKFLVDADIRLVRAECPPHLV